MITYFKVSTQDQQIIALIVHVNVTDVDVVTCNHVVLCISCSWDCCVLNCSLFFFSHHVLCFQNVWFPAVQWNAPAHTTLSMWAPVLSHVLQDILDLFKVIVSSLSSHFLSYLFCRAINTTFKCKGLACQSNILLYLSFFIALDHY